MPAVFGTPQQIALVRSFAKRGDAVANAIMELMDNTFFADMSAGAEAGDTIAVTGQIKDQDGNAVSGVKNVVLRALNTAGDTCTVTVTTGTAKAGDGSKEVWLETDANGQFVVDVLLQNAAASQAGDVLIEAVLDNGTTEMLKLTFA